MKHKKKKPIESKCIIRMGELADDKPWMTYRVSNGEKYSEIKCSPNGNMVLESGKINIECGD